MEMMQKKEAHEDKARYYLDGITRKVIDLELGIGKLSDEEIRDIKAEIHALDMSLKSVLSVDKKSFADAGIEEEYNKLMERKEELLTPEIAEAA